MSKPRRIQTAGTWRSTEEGLLYAVVAQSGEEVLARADVTLQSGETGPSGDPTEVLPEAMRTSVEGALEKVVRQQAVRVLDGRREPTPEDDSG